MRRSIISLAVLCAALFTWACTEATPEEKVAKARARYNVTLNGYFPKEQPAPAIEVPAVAEEGEAVADAEAVADEAAGEEGEEGMEEEPVAPRGVDILLDLIVQHDMDDALPGITVDIEMVDPELNPKGSWRVYIETAGLPKANQKQVTHVLEATDWEEGDAFSATIVSGVPADLGEYREFATAGP